MLSERQAVSTSLGIYTYCALHYKDSKYSGSPSLATPASFGTINLNNALGATGSNIKFGIKTQFVRAKGYF